MLKNLRYLYSIYYRARMRKGFCYVSFLVVFGRRVDLSPRPGCNGDCMSEEIIPRSIDAEGEVLAALLLDPRLMDEVLGRGLRKQDFYLNRHGMLFDVMSELYRATGSFDEVMLKQRMEDVGIWDAFGGAMFLSKVMDRAGTTGNLSRYCDIVLDKSMKRSIVEAGDAVSRLGYTDLPPLEALDQAEERLRSLYKRSGSADGVYAHDAMREYLDRVDSIQRGEYEDTVIPTGISSLDEMLSGGFRPGWQVVVMSCPAHGKSSLAVNNFGMTAARAGFPVLICSYEMSEMEVYARMVAAESGVPVHVQRRPGMDPYDLSRVKKAGDDIAPLPIIVEGPKCGSISAIRRAARRMAVEHGRMGMVIVDYLQLMRGGSSRRDGTQEEGIAANSRGLKLLAVELGCVVVLLSQPVLEAKRARKRPHISDAKGSGAIEDDADLTLIPWLPSKVDNVDRSLAEIGIDKFRHGAARHLTREDVRFSGARMRFEGM